MKAGVLALQGAFREHREVLDALGVEAVEVRVPEHLGGLDALFMPVVERVGEAVEVLAAHDEHAVLVRQGAIWAATFHPELSGDLRLHQRFLTEGTAATAALPTGAAESELATAPKEKT